MKKKPSTSELLDWLKLLLVEDIGPETCASATRRSLFRRCTARVLKNEQDVHLFRAAGVLGATRGTNLGVLRCVRPSPRGARPPAASSSTTETSGKSARANLSCARASTPSRSIGDAAMSLGATGSAGKRGERRLFRQVRPRHHRPEPCFDLHLIVPFAPRRALGHTLIFFLALARRARLEALEPVEPPIKDLHRRAAEPAAGPDSSNGANNRHVSSPSTTAWARISPAWRWCL